MTQGLRAHGGSCGETRFDSQHPHGGSQTFVTRVPVDLMPCSDPPILTSQNQACTCHTYTHRDKTLMHKIARNQIFKKS